MRIFKPDNFHFPTYGADWSPIVHMMCQMEASRDANKFITHWFKNNTRRIYELDSGYWTSDPKKQKGHVTERQGLVITGAVLDEIRYSFY